MKTLLGSAVREEGFGFLWLVGFIPRAASPRLGWPWAAIGRTLGAEEMAAMRAKLRLNRVPFMHGIMLSSRLPALQICLMFSTETGRIE